MADHDSTTNRDDLVERLRSAADWVNHQMDTAPAWDGLLAEAAAEIERLGKENHALQLRIQDSWKRIEDLEQDPTPDQQVALVRAWRWVRVANYHDARPGRDGPDVKACSHLDTDWCSQRDKGRMVPVFRPSLKGDPRA